MAASPEGRVRSVSTKPQSLKVLPRQMSKPPRPRGAPMKDFWMTTGTSFHGVPRKGCLAYLHLYEENARFVLLALFLVGYMLFGAIAFQYLEADQEKADKKRYRDLYEKFLAMHDTVLNHTALRELLSEHAQAATRGDLYDQERWSMGGSLYFVGTVMSTIGYGMTFPRTTAGRVMVICYGFFGCSGAILFFNLFLERVVTFCAYLLRRLHEFSEWLNAKRGRPRVPEIKVHCYADSDSVSELDQPKPSVYGVLLLLLVLGAALVSVGAAMYSFMEGWPYLSAVYYCFVSFATIGFGDFVAAQNATNASVYGESYIAGLYGLAHFFFLTTGCCCVYSLNNVTTIVIRKCLNWIIKKSDWKCERPAWLKNRAKPYLGLGLSRPLDTDDVESGSCSPSPLCSEGMMSLKDFLAHNQMSIVLMQRRLIEHAQQARLTLNQNPYDTGAAISANSVGPLAILSQKFGEDE